jgi:hypothetical protein
VNNGFDARLKLRETVAWLFSQKVLGVKMVFNKMTIETTVFLSNSTAGLTAGYAETRKRVIKRSR